MRILFSGETGPVGTSVVGWPLLRLQGYAETIIEQIMMERLLDAVSPKLRAWLKEQEPKTAEEFGNLASLHVQSRKGPLVGGKYVTKRGGGKSGKKERFGGKADDSLPEEKQNQNQEKP